ncbi:hypothetical protein VYU27_010271, partial [Nannochloropsis oceanica]
LLAGPYRVPKLIEISLQVIIHHWPLYQHVDFAEILPTELFSLLRRMQSHATSLPLSTPPFHHDDDDEEEEEEGEEEGGGGFPSFMPLGFSQENNSSAFGSTAYMSLSQ